MTVSSEVKRSDFAGNGSTTAFATGFRFLQNSDIKVILTVTSTGVETVQVEVTNYTLVGAGLDAGGTVTMLVAPATGETLTIKRDVPLTQGTEYVENDTFPAESHEDALDKLTMIVQQQQEELDRTIKLAETSQSTDVTVSDPNDGDLLKWDDQGNLVNVAVVNLDAAIITPFGRDLIDSVDAAAAADVLELDRLNPDTLAIWQDDTRAQAGDVVTTKERTAGFGGGAEGNVTSGTGTANGRNIVAHNTLSLSWSLKAEIPTIAQLGALSDSTTDIFALLVGALADFNAIVVTEGNYYSSGMTEIGSNQAVFLDNNAVITKFSAFTTNSEPVFYLNGNFAQLLGVSFSSSRVISERNSTDGVVLVGHRDLTASHANVNYCTVSGVRLSSNIAGGQTDTSTDRCLVIQNPQFGGFTSYFHNIKDLLLENANVGIEFRGFANGILGGNIHGFRLGNTTAGIAAFIWVRGALDNAMSDFFFHQSSDSTGLLIDELDNTSNGGSLHVPSSSSYKGLAFEQGGASAKGIIANSGSNHYIEARDNVSGGNTFAAGFLENNVVVLNKSISTDLFQAKRLSVSDTMTLNDAVERIDTTTSLTIFSETQFHFDTLAENTAYKLVEIDILITNRAVIVEVDFSGRVNGFGNGGGGGKVIYKVSRAAGGALSTAVMNFRSDGPQPMLAGLSGNVATLALTTPNNGTSTTGHTMTGTIKIYGRRDSIYTPTFFNTATVIAGLSVMPENTSPV